MFRITMKEYFMELYLTLRGWRMLIIIILTLLVCFIDYDTKTGSSQYLLIYWLLRQVNTLPRQQEDKKLIYLLPSNQHWRASRMIYRAMAAAIFIALWRISIYGIDILLGSYTPIQALKQFINLDLLMAMFVVTPGEFIIGNSVKRKKAKRLHLILVVVIASLIGISLLVYISSESLQWWNIVLTLIEYLGMFLIWYLEIRSARDWDTSYESVVRKAVKI
ncbi:MAG: hypothetical protein K0R34_952 [Herbinix sp.]|nr:hypothetical protein [Herbinix sp.]